MAVIHPHLDTVLGEFSGIIIFQLIMFNVTSYQYSR